jgi:hypothetical protein
MCNNFQIYNYNLIKCGVLSASAPRLHTLGSRCYCIHVISTSMHLVTPNEQTFLPWPPPSIHCDCTAVLVLVGTCSNKNRQTSIDRLERHRRRQPSRPPAPAHPHHCKYNMHAYQQSSNHGHTWIGACADKGAASWWQRTCSGCCGYTQGLPTCPAAWPPR